MSEVVFDSLAREVTSIARKFEVLSDREKKLVGTSVLHNNTKFTWFENGKPRQQIIEDSIWNSMLLTYVMLKLRCGAIKDAKHIWTFAKF